MKHLLRLLTAALAVHFLVIAAHAQAPADLSQYATADALWLHIEDLEKGPKTRPATAAEYQVVMSSMVWQVCGATTEFLKRYPNDPRRWDARLLQIQTTGAISRISGHPEDLAEARQLQELSRETDAPVSVRGHARQEVIGLTLKSFMAGNQFITSQDLVNQLRQFAAEFPTYPSLDVLKYQVAQTINLKDPAAADALLRELAASGEGRIADLARTVLATKEKLKSPLDLHFTAVDGTPVDIANLRGKVVLVDFWATWCGPCRAELPNVIAAYNKLHDRGFEIIGISLDQDREKLVTFTAQNGMTWPQYFDGKVWQNGISSSFAIQSVPTMWLVNKKGYVVTTNGRSDLEGQVEKLLAEQE